MVDWVNLRASSTGGQGLLDLFCERSLIQHVLQPKQVANNILDFVLAESELLCDSTAKETFATSDHCYIMFDLSVGAR